MNPFLHPFALITLAMTAASVSTAQDAQPDRPAPSGIFWLDWAAEQMAFAVEEAIPADSMPATVAPLTTTTLPATHSIESVATDRLREEIRLMRDLIEQGVVGRIIALENEVRTLRNALHQQQIAAYGNGNVIPQPGLPQGMASNPILPVEQGGPSPMPRPDPANDLPPEDFEFTVLNEWGRSPETVAELGGNASTLIGLTGVVPPRSSREDVSALIQELRAEYDAYDNINIEIFDSEAAAQAFVDDQSLDSAHHVATISRHRASGRDLILYLGRGLAEAVPPATE